MAAPDPSPGGYWLADEVGRVLAFGSAQHYGDLAGIPDPTPGGIAGIVSSPTGNGYWLYSAAGRVFAFGDAAFLGDLSPPATPPAVGGISLDPRSIAGGDGAGVVDAAAVGALLVALGGIAGWRVVRRREAQPKV